MPQPRTCLKPKCEIFWTLPSVGLVDKIQPMKEIFAELIRDAEAELEAVKARLAGISG